MKTKQFVFNLIAVGLLFSACGRKQFVTNFEHTAPPPTPQYSDLKNWAAHPDKRDNADSVPLNSGLHDAQATAEVDVFFVHPTTYTTQKGEIHWNGSLEDTSLNAKTDQGSILNQASIFNAAGRVYAPRYRQAHYNAYLTNDKTSSKAAFELAYDDVRTAFEYYLKNWNNGRPIIIAAHSQGMQHAAHLLKDFFDEKPLKNRLVVAYIVGLPILKTAFKTIPVCETPDQTGCFCAWRTFHRGYEPKAVFPTGSQYAVVNPLSMTTAEGTVSDEKHKGAVILGFKKTEEHMVDAEIHNGILWVRKPTFRGSFLLRMQNYHILDFNLFYFNVREDAQRRVGLFWKR